MCEMLGVLIVSQNQTSTVLLALFPGWPHPAWERGYSVVWFSFYYECNLSLTSSEIMMWVCKSRSQAEASAGTKACVDRARTFP